MKKWMLVIGIAFLGLGACEDVIEVDTPTEDPRLVIEGLLRVDTSETYIPVEIRLTQTANFFDEIEPVTDVDEIVIVYQELVDGIPSGETFRSSLTQLDQGSGIYVPDPSFDNDQRIPTRILEDDYLFTLIIRWRGRRYAGQAQYVTSVPIDSLRIGDQTLFDEDETQLIVNFTDDPDRDNFYVFDFGFGNYFSTEDTFYKGQPFEFSYFYDEKFASGTVLEVGLFGADQNFYNYMGLLLEQTEGRQGPFQTPATTVRGNMFDVTDLDNDGNTDNSGQADIFPLGYFAVVQEFTAEITIE